jgi:asparagine synthase (glutamine-hydrolysing)
VFFTVEQGIALLDKLIWHLETYDIISVRASVPMYFCRRQSRNQELKSCFLVKDFGGYLYFEMRLPQRNFKRNN